MPNCCCSTWTPPQRLQDASLRSRRGRRIDPPHPARFCALARKKPALTAPRTQAGPSRHPPSHGNAVSAQERRFAPQSRRGARSRIALTGACVPIAGTGRTGAATPKRQGRSGRHGDGAEDRPRGGAGDPARGGAKVPAVTIRRGRGWRGVDIVLDWPEQSRRPRRCQARSRVLDPLDSRLHRVAPAPRRDWSTSPPSARSTTDPPAAYLTT